MTAQAEAPTLVAALVGRPGLAFEVFGRLLEDQGIMVVNGLGDQFDESGEPDVAVLLDPQPEDWSPVQHRGIPIVLVLGDEADDGTMLEAVMAGADAVLTFTASPTWVSTVLRAVSGGGTILAPVQARAVTTLARDAASRPAVVLSRREGEILALIAAGQAVKQTARSLGISPKTVENLQSRLFRKLGVRNRAQAVARAHGLGLL